MTRSTAPAARKYEAMVEEIKAANAKEQPVLVGTTSIEKSEMFSQMLTAAGSAQCSERAPARARSADYCDAGKLGAVTIATNMAGRGTDIQLGRERRDEGAGGACC